MLCSNRYPLPGSPSTCLIDTVLVPLPSFLFIIALPIALFYQRGRTLPRIHSDRWMHISYLFSVATNLATTITELTRLASGNLGVGLLPMTTIGLMLAFFVLLTERKGLTRVVSMVLASYWFLLSIMFIIKSARLHLLEKLDPTTTENSEYPNSDWFLDNVLMHDLYVYTSDDGTNFQLLKGSAYTPTTGVFRDPSIILQTEKYYIVCGFGLLKTVRTDTTGWNDTNFAIASSSDLLSWTLAVATIPTTSSVITPVNSWVPALQTQSYITVSQTTRIRAPVNSTSSYPSPRRCTAYVSTARLKHGLGPLLCPALPTPESGLGYIDTFPIPVGIGKKHIEHAIA
ncbi:hypothetical protein BDZ89DRAFT_1128299 [Hymenopellis radicata]|nr:hypothetical protein BDZ89DRAFT_1128299 [Hymenopellis radicata]